MKRKRWLLAGLVVVALVAVMVVATRPHGVTVANADRVRVGMTEAEVEELFGQPAINGWAVSADSFGLPPLAATPDRLARWESESATVVVYFADNRAVGTSASRYGPESFWSRLRARLGL